jgi:uncharacterized protein (DUF488 family)
MPGNATICCKAVIGGNAISAETPTVFSVGHSNHPIEKFLGLLSAHDITAIADVRSTPYSRFNPQYNQKSLAATLADKQIAYVFLGKELGARSEDASCYENGKVQYQRLAQTPLFKSGIERVLSGAARYRVALMCAEKEPLDCHRTLLVSRALQNGGASIVHILADGTAEPQAQTMQRLLKSLPVDKHDLFTDRAAQIEAACRLREQKIAYVKTQKQKKERTRKPALF